MIVAMLLDRPTLLHLEYATLHLSYVTLQVVYTTLQFVLAAFHCVRFVMVVSSLDFVLPLDSVAVADLWLSIAGTGPGTGAGFLTRFLRDWSSSRKRLALALDLIEFALFLDIATLGPSVTTDSYARIHNTLS